MRLTLDQYSALQRRRGAPVEREADLHADIIDWMKPHRSRWLQRLVRKSA